MQIQFRETYFPCVILPFIVNYIYILYRQQFIWKTTWVKIVKNMINVKLKPNNLKNKDMSEIFISAAQFLTHFTKLLTWHTLLTLRFPLEFIQTVCKKSLDQTGVLNMNRVFTVWLLIRSMNTVRIIFNNKHVESEGKIGYAFI